MHREGRNLYYVKDGLGSVTALTDSAGSVVHEYAYSVFGEIIDEGGESVKNPFTYTAREWEPEVGLYFYRARFYDTKIGRFLSEDPIGIDGGGNFYRFEGNSPISFVDPLGLWSISVTFYGFNGTPGVGIGGTVTVGSSGGTNFVDVQAGIGVGGGVSVNPSGSAPSQAQLNGQGTGAYGGFSGNVGIGTGVGHVGVGGDYSGSKGVGGKNEGGQMSGGSYSNHGGSGSFGSSDKTGFSAGGGL